VQFEEAGVYSVRVANTFGSVTSSNALLSVNRIPVAKISASPVADFPWLTDLFVISPNNANALVVLDGSKSSDPDQDPLTYAWFEGTNHFADGVVATNVFAVASHTITLVVSDGMAAGTATGTVEVITAGEAIRLIVSLIEGSNLDPNSQHPLLAILQESAASFDRGDFTSGINQLQEFQNQVRAEIAPSDSAVASTLVQAAEQVLNAVGRGGPGNHRGPRFQSLACRPDGTVRVSFASTAGQVHIIQASTNLIDWEMIGVATDHGDGSFDFEDANAWRFPSRFYRSVSP